MRTRTFVVEQPHLRDRTVGRRVGRPVRVAVALGIVMVLAISGCGGGQRGRISALGSAAAPTPGAPMSSSPSAPGAPLGMGTWRSLPASPIPADYNVGVWTGTELLIHAIVTVDGEGTHGTADAAYDPVKNSWRRLPPSPYPVRNVEGGTRVVWTGTEMLAFGMMDAAFAPATNRWRQLAAGAPAPAVTVWTGRQVLMWGGGCCGSSTADGVAYDVNSNSWQPMPAAPLAARHADGVWTGTEHGHHRWAGGGHRFRRRRRVQPRHADVADAAAAARARLRCHDHLDRHRDLCRWRRAPRRGGAHVVRQGHGI